MGCGPLNLAHRTLPPPGAHHSANVMLSLMGFFRGLAAVPACPPSVHWAQREGRASGDITDAILSSIRSVVCTSTTSCSCFHPCSCMALGDACAGATMIDGDAHAGLTRYGKHCRQGSTGNAFAFNVHARCQDGKRMSARQKQRSLLYHSVFLNSFQIVCGKCFWGFFLSDYIFIFHCYIFTHTNTSHLKLVFLQNACRF